MKASWTRNTIALGLGLLALVGGALAVHGQEDSEARIEISAPVVPSVFDGDLRDLPVVPKWRPGDAIKEIPRRHTGQPDVLFPAPPPLDVDPLLALQDSVRMSGLQKVFTTPDLNFAGQGFTGVNPPDTVGDVGVDYFIQMINAGGGAVYTVYNKSNGSVAAGPTTLDSLGSGACGSGLGDPIVLYDELASRWVLAEFSGSANAICVYVSQTSNPISGGWYAYTFTTPNFPDYFKIGVWPDAYYVGSNENSPALYALDRDQMLQGLSATSQRVTVPDLGGFGFQLLNPSHLNGTTLPPAGSPNFFMRHRDDEAHNPGSNNPSADFVEIWEYTANFGGSPTLNGPINIQVAELDSTLCGLTSFSCVPQPGTGVQLDPLREPVMFRLQYRNFGTHEALIGNFAVDVGSNRAGIRWFELRRNGGAWSLFQEGTYSPGSLHRWMGAIAVDQSGNIALGYNTGSSSVFPGLRYVGRLAGDPLGTLPQGEVTLVNGSASNSSNRYGDYASMGVDPVDGCTFWFTGMYNVSSSWSTRIGSFSFDSCGGTGNTAPQVTISQPADSSAFTVGDPITFTGSATDAEDGNLSSSLSWSSSIDGTIGSGASFVTSSLSIGTHTITASVTDSGGLPGSDAITVIVNPVGGACSVDETFSGGAGGWTNSGSSTCSTGSFVVGTPTEVINGGVTTQVGGDHTTGSGNAFFSAVNTAAGTNDVDGGTCIVESPIYSVSEASDVSVWYFHGQRDTGGDDFFELEISTNGGSTWSSMVSIGAVSTNAVWTEATATVPAGSNVRFRVQVADGPSGGDLVEAGVDDISICPSVGGNTPPQVTINQPANGSTFDEGQSITFSGTATDAEDGNLSSSLSWSSSIDGAIGSGASFATSSLSVGSHTITASVTDSGSLVGSDAISLTVNAVGPGCTDCIDWSTTTTVSYSNQDVSADVTVEDGGSTIFLQDNTWRRTTQTFTITANTVLEFEYQSTAQGEIHGIGFDEDDTLTNNLRVFQFWGTQNWTGAIQYTPRYSGSGSFETFQIPVGQSYTGTMFLVLTNDNDAGSGNNGRFRNVRVFEDTPPGGCAADEDFSGGAGGWTNSPSSTCSTGSFVVGTPTEVINGGVTTQVGGDHTTGSGNAFFSAVNTAAGTNDVDGGTCVVLSPIYAVSEASDVSVWYFHGQRDAGGDDFFELEISTNGGSTWSSMVSIGAVSTNAAWTEATTTVTAGSNVQFRVQVADGPSSGDLVEAGIDDVSICP